VPKFLSYCALTGGVVLLDHMVGRLRDVLGVGEKPTLLAYFDPHNPLLVQGFVAANVVPLNEQTAGVWTECRSRLSKACGNGPDDCVERDVVRRVLVRLAMAQLAGKPLPIRPLARSPKSAKATRGAARGKASASEKQARIARSMRDVEELLAELDAIMR
jgi:hypothetical protein